MSNPTCGVLRGRLGGTRPLYLFIYLFVCLSSLSAFIVPDVKSGRLKVTVTKPPSEHHIGASTPCALQASMMRLAPLPQFS